MFLKEEAGELCKVSTLQVTNLSSWLHFTHVIKVIPNSAAAAMSLVILLDFHSWDVNASIKYLFLPLF